MAKPKKLSIALICLFFVSGVFASEPDISIDSIRFINAESDSVNIEISGVNKSGGDICLDGYAKSNDGIIRPNVSKSTRIESNGKPGKFNSVIQFFRPFGDGPKKTDVLFVMALSCADESVITSKRFNWEHDWQSSTKAANKMLASILETPLQIFQENILSEDFQAIDILLGKWSRKEERDVDGDWKLSSFDYALTSTCQKEGKPSDWKKCLQRINHWKAVSPKTAKLAEAKYWSDYAWSVRGDKHAVNVDPYAMKLFSARMKKAEQAMSDIRYIKNSNPIWYEMYIRIAIDTKRDTNFTVGLFDEAIRKFPEYITLYSVMMSYWAKPSEGRENWKELDNLVNKATAFTYAEDGDSNYARLYSTLVYNLKYSESIFQVSLVSWPKMKGAFETMIAHYPSPSNINEFTFLACQANDKNTFLTLRPQIEKQLMPQIWPDNYSVDLCQRKFMQQS